MIATLRRLADRVARALALAAIRGYKRHLSPRKGFACAYRVHTGRASCSTLGYRAVSRYGVFRGLGILDERLAQCRIKHEKYGPRATPRSTPRLHPSQAGFVDCGGCDVPAGCDLPGCDLPGCDLPHFGACDACDFLSGCMPVDDGGCCDTFGRRRRERRERGRRGPAGEPGQATGEEA